MPLSAPITKLRRDARVLARREALPLHAALDRIATSEGYRAWSHLAAEHPAGTSPGALLDGLAPGDVILVAARPRQGKTRLGLDLALAAADAGTRSFFFTLDYTAPDVVETLRAMDRDPARIGAGFTLDTSDEICADWIIAAMADAPRRALATIDYMQLLDQRRDTPPLQEQIGALAGAAHARGHIFVVLGQIDRHFTTSDRAMPDLGDIRLPNPLDLELFTGVVFLQDGRRTLVRPRTVTR